MTRKDSKSRRSEKEGKSSGNRSDNNLEQDQAKRKSLRTILAGSGIIAGAGGTIPTWEKPVIDSILLPAHAQTSPDSEKAPSTSSPDL